MNAPRPLPPGFSSRHAPRATLASVYAAHVALPTTVISLLLAFVATEPSAAVRAVVFALCTCSWAVLAYGLYRSRCTGASKVWKYGELVDATIVGRTVRDETVDLRVRWQQGGIVRIGAVVGRRTQELEEARTIRIAVLDGAQPIVAPASPSYDAHSMTA